MIHQFEQYSDDWWLCRNGKPSASCASKLVTTTGKESTQLDDYAAELAGDLFAGHSLNTFMGNSYTDRGTELESLARADYELNNQVAVDEVGMFSDSLIRYIASPDGCIGKDGLLEIKVLKPSNHIKTVCAYYDDGIIPKTYIPQIQMQLLISKRKWVDLCFFNPDLPILVIRQYPDSVFLKTLSRQLKAVEVQRNLYLEKLKSI